MKKKMLTEILFAGILFLGGCSVTNQKETSTQKTVKKLQK